MKEFLPPASYVPRSQTQRATVFSLKAELATAALLCENPTQEELLRVWDFLSSMADTVMLSRDPTRSIRFSIFDALETCYLPNFNRRHIDHLGEDYDRVLASKKDQVDATSSRRIDRRLRELTEEMGGPTEALDAEDAWNIRLCLCKLLTDVGIFEPR
jgi:hypothetical protein